ERALLLLEDHVLGGAQAPAAVLARPHEAGPAGIELQPLPVARGLEPLVLGVEGLAGEAHLANLREPVPERIPADPCAPIRAAAPKQQLARASSMLTSMSAIKCFSAWNEPIGRPKA